MCISYSETNHTCASHFWRLIIHLHLIFRDKIYIYISYSAHKAMSITVTISTCIHTHMIILLHCQLTENLGWRDTLKRTSDVLLFVSKAACWPGPFHCLLAISQHPTFVQEHIVFICVFRKPFKQLHVSSTQNHLICCKRAFNGCRIVLFWVFWLLCSSCCLFQSSFGVRSWRIHADSCISMLVYASMHTFGLFVCAWVCYIFVHARMYITCTQLFT